MSTNKIVENHIIADLMANAPDAYGLLCRLINSDWEFATPELREYAQKMRAGEFYDEEALWSWAESL